MLTWLLVCFLKWLNTYLYLEMKNRLHLIRPGKTFANILLNINCFKILPQMTRGSSFQEEFVDFLVTFRSSHADVFHKKVFLDILQNSQENSCARDSLLIKMKTVGIKKSIKMPFISLILIFVLKIMKFLF